MSIILQFLPRLREFFGREPEGSEESPVFLVGSRSRGFLIKFYADGVSLFAEIGAKFPASIVKEALTKTEAEGFAISVSQSDDSLRISTSVEAGIEPVLSFIRNLLRCLMKENPRVAWNLFGEMIVKALGKEITVVSKGNPMGQLGWRTEIVATIPDRDGWFETNYGRDNIRLPLLSSVNHEIRAYTPFEDGSLRRISLTRALELVDKLGAFGLSSHVKDEVDLYEKAHKLASALEVIDAGAGLLGASGIPHEVKEEAKAILRLLERAKGFDEIVRLKASIREAVKVAKDIVEGGQERGIIVVNVRRVTKLGGGKAIYIGKEELSAIKLGERVIVKVIDEDGRRKIVIEPLE